MSTTDSSARPTAREGNRPGEQQASGRRAERELRRASRRERIPRNVYFARVDGRIAALLVGRSGQLRIQGSADEPWQLYQVTQVDRRRGRLRLGIADRDSLTLAVYGSGEAGRLDLGRGRVRPASAPFWKLSRYRARREAAAALHTQLER